MEKFISRMCRWRCRTHSSWMERGPWNSTSQNLWGQRRQLGLWPRFLHRPPRGQLPAETPGERGRRGVRKGNHEDSVRCPPWKETPPQIPPGADLPALEGVDVTHKLHQGGLRRAGDQGRHRPHPRRRLARLLHLLLEVGPFLLPVQGVIQGPRLPPLELCRGGERGTKKTCHGGGGTVQGGL